MAGLRIDDEAKSLCNRHEICYTCGGSLSFSQSTCDAGFRGDVIEMCGKDTECIENGAKFLWFLKSEHTYNYVYLDKCDSGCVSDFIKGLWNYNHHFKKLYGFIISWIFWNSIWSDLWKSLEKKHTKMWHERSLLNHCGLGVCSRTAWFVKIFIITLFKFL